MTTTSRSRGFTNNDRSQKVFGSGAKPSESKNRSPYRTISFASIWLVPRLARFRRSHPKVDVRIKATWEVVDLEREGIKINFGPGGVSFSPQLMTVEAPASPQANGIEPPTSPSPPPTT